MRESVKHRLVWFALLALCAGIMSGCIVGSDDDPESTPTTEPPGTATSPGASPAASPESIASPSATPSPTAPPPTPTSTPRPTATATPIPKAPLGEIVPLDPVAIPNYSLATQIDLKGVPSQADFAMTLAIQQSAPDHYYLRSTSGSSTLESWLVDGTTYLTQADGGVAPLPAGSDTALFSPALLVQTIPAISGDTLATPLGSEQVGSRQASRYRIDAEDLLDMTSWLPGDQTRNAEGFVDIWIDNELGIVLRQESDVTWRNRDRSEGSFIGHYEVTNISTTVPVTAPG